MFQYSVLVLILVPFWFTATLVFSPALKLGPEVILGSWLFFLTPIAKWRSKVSLFSWVNLDCFFNNSTKSKAVTYSLFVYPPFNLFCLSFSKWSVIIFESSEFRVIQVSSISKISCFSWKSFPLIKVVKFLTCCFSEISSAVCNSAWTNCNNFKFTQAFFHKLEYWSLTSSILIFGANFFNNLIFDSISVFNHNIFKES